MVVLVLFIVLYCGEGIVGFQPIIVVELSFCSAVVPVCAYCGRVLLPCQKFNLARVPELNYFGTKVIRLWGRQMKGLDVYIEWDIMICNFYQVSSTGMLALLLHQY